MEVGRLAFHFSLSALIGFVMSTLLTADAPGEKIINNVFLWRRLLAPPLTAAASIQGLYEKSDFLPPLPPSARKAQ